MDYALAKELKDAGFPDSGSWTEINFTDGEKAFIEGTIATVPTLSELIEACGEDFNFVSRFVDNIADPLSRKLRHWCASGDDPSNRFKSVSLTGPTPEEAVARLWLALRK